MEGENGTEKPVTTGKGKQEKIKKRGAGSGRVDNM